MIRHRALAHRLLMAVLLSVAPVALPQQSKQEPRPRESGNHASVTEDLSQGGSVTFKIAPNLPEFTFKVIPEPSARDEFGNAQATVRDIEVFRGDAKQPLQHLDGCDWSAMEPPSTGAEWIRVQDVNFDGYQDIYVMTWWGATGNQGGCRWLYNPTTGHFDYSKEFSEISDGLPDPSTKTILTYSRGGMAGLVYDANRFRVENNKPVRVWHQNQDWDHDRKQFHCVEEQRQGDHMVTIRDAWGAKGNDDVGPCDPEKLFPR